MSTSETGIAEARERSPLRAAGPVAGFDKPSQPSVFSEGKDHALYLWIHLKPEARPQHVAKSVAKLQQYAADVVKKDKEGEILAGVGFGPNLWSQVSGKTKKNFDYRYRKGNFGDMPSSGGDVFIHAKCNRIGPLFDLAGRVIRELPKGSIDKMDDIYGFHYQNSRDLSGFIDGTGDPKGADARQQVAVEKETGGSYVITQTWIHDFVEIHRMGDGIMESWIGRKKSDGAEIKQKKKNAHVARMRGGDKFQHAPKFQIVRQSMPFGSHTAGAGLFFLAYAASPENFEFMLDRMVGAGDDDGSDELMLFTRNNKGTFWYFPGVEELKKLE